MEKKGDELSHVSSSRLAQIIVVTLKVRLAKRKTAQHSASESRGTQGGESSTVCSRGDQQVYGIEGCTG